MEENLLTTAPESNDTKGCVNCGNINVEEGYPTPLCTDCRRQFIKYPIPLGIKIFAAAVGVVLILSLFTFPKHLAMALHLERGKLFERNHQYMAAQQEFSEVKKKVPNNAEAAGRMAIAAFYNMDFETVASLSSELQVVRFDDHDLFSRVQDVVDRLHEYVPGDSLESFLNRYAASENGIPDSAYHSYFIRYPDDLYGQMTYAGAVLTKRNYTLCDSILNVVLDMDGEYFPALRLLAGSQREQGQLEEAIKTCDKIIGINRDAAYAYAIKSRIYLKEKQDAKGLELAKKSVALDKKDAYNTATLALAYHFNNMTKERDALIGEARASKDTSVMGYMQYALDIIDKKEPFRN